jgi:inosine-uridine nucleoside N-ribohydrolase
MHAHIQHTHKNEIKNNPNNTINNSTNEIEIIALSPLTTIKEFLQAADQRKPLWPQLHFSKVI